MILILSESSVVIKLNLIMMSLLTMPTSFIQMKRNAVGKTAKFRAIPTAKSNNSSNSILLGDPKIPTCMENINHFHNLHHSM